MSIPVVSIVVPTYKRPNELVRAVNSILAQTYTDWELFVVNDDPGTDVSDVLPSDDRIRYIHHEENQGAPAARNNGIESSSGEYIALLDDDDAWKPEKLERQVAVFEELPDTYGLVYTGRDIVHDGQVVEEYLPTDEGRMFDRLLHQNVIPSETPLVRRECFETVGIFDTELRSAQDLDMWLRISHEYNVAVISESLAVAYQGHNDRISNDMERKYAGQRRLVEKYRRELEDHPDALAHRYKQIGVYATRAGRRREGAKHLLAAARYGRDLTALLYATTNILPRQSREKVFKTLDHIF